MFKLTQAAAGIAAALLAFSAQAADFQIRGVIDLGLTVTHAKHGDTTLSMTPDNYIGSGFDFLGEEKLSGTTKVGFALLNRFNPDTGAFQTQDKLFDYESQLYVEGPYGLIGAGRMSPFSASVGTQGWMCPFDVFEAGYQDAGLQSTQQTTWAAYDNSLYYVTPTFKGFKAGLFYSFSGDAKENARQSKNNRFWNAAIRYSDEKLSAMVSAEGDIRSTDSDLKDGRVFRAAASYDFGRFKVMGGYNRAEHQYQYAYATFNENLYSMTTASGEALKKGISSDQAWIGIRVPINQYEVVAQYQYLDGKVKDDGTKFKRHVLALGGYYYMSKRTLMYADVSQSIGRGALSWDNDGSDTNYTAFQVGMTHFF